MAKRLGKRVASRHVPYSSGSILAGRHEPFAVWTEPDRVDPTSVPHRRYDGRAGRRIPNLRRATSGCGDSFSIRTEPNRVAFTESVRMDKRVGPNPAGSGIPDSGL